MPERYLGNGIYVRYEGGNLVLVNKRWGHNIAVDHQMMCELNKLIDGLLKK